MIDRHGISTAIVLENSYLFAISVQENHCYWREDTLFVDFFYQDDIQIEPHILLFNAIESFAKMYLAHPSWAKILCCFKSSCGIFSHFTYLEIKMEALTCIQYINLAPNN